LQHGGRLEQIHCTTYGAVVNIAIIGEEMDTRTILADLKAELNRLNQAIAALESLDGTVTATTFDAKAAPKQAKKRGLTPAGRRRLSEKMKARWAARHKAAAKPATKATSGRRTVSAASRKKMAEAQRKRWAARRKQVAKPATKKTLGRRTMSPAARKRISAMMKKRWAARRKAAVKPAPKQTRGRRTMSAAARKKIAEAQKKRWAVQKKAAKKITTTMTTVETPAEAAAATGPDYVVLYQKPWK
jgi:hypothetical protein